MKKQISMGKAADEARNLFVLGMIALLNSACSNTQAPTPTPTVDEAEVFADATDAAGTAIAGEVVELKREQIVDAIYHYEILLKVGDTPNARIRVHRVVREDVPWRVRSKSHSMLLLHGDFANFTTNFVPSRISAAVKPDHDLAVYLAERGVDVWGLDRRWTTTPKEGADFGDFADMGVAQGIADTGRALRFVRSVRAQTGAGEEQMFLGGFSSGAHFTYLYAAHEAQQAAEQQHIKAIVPIDIYAQISPLNDAARQVACDNAALEKDLLAQGSVDSDNSSFFHPLGELATSDPMGPSPIFDGFTNRDAMLGFVTQTYQVYEPKPKYHLMAGAFADGAPTGLRYASEALVADWLAHAPPHQALVEGAERDALWCGIDSQPDAAPLQAIKVPLLYLGAAGGFGTHGFYTTTLVGSTDASSLVVTRLAVDQESEDFGHADLLYADDAPQLTWDHLAQWLLAH